MTPFSYSSHNHDGDRLLTEVMASTVPSSSLLIAESERETLLAQAPSPRGGPDSPGSEGPYSLTDGQGLQQVIFVEPSPALDHRLYKQVRTWVAPFRGSRRRSWRCT